MGWRDDLRPATFRDLPFAVRGSELSSGRRLAKHEFVNSAIPYIEDMGRKTRAFRLDCFLVGDDYMQRRDFFMGALDSLGSGLLVHPYFGELIVNVEDYTEREAGDIAGAAIFSITFIESGRFDPELGDYRADAVANHNAAINASADVLTVDAGDDFVDTVEVESVSEFRRLEVSDELEVVGHTLAGLDVFSRKSQEVAAYSKKVQSLIDNAATLATSPLELVDAVTLAIRDIVNAAGNAFDALYAYEALFGIDTIGDSENARAVTTLTERVALAEAARVAVDVEWDSYSQALAARDELVEHADILVMAAPDSVFLSIEDLRGNIVDAIPSEAADIPRLGTLVLSAAMPSLVVAYDLYDDISQAADLVLRNEVRHPGFVPGGESLEILTDG